MSASLRVGVIGTGTMGEVHVRNLHGRVRGSEVVALADRGSGRAAALAQGLGIGIVHRDGHEVIRDPAVEAVVVASPDPTHAEYALACIAAGKPVLCEKPMATTAADALRVLQAEAAAGRRLVQVGFMREFDPPHRAVLDAVRSGRVGRPMLFRAIHVTPSEDPGRLSPDELVTMGLIHDFHSARVLMGCEIADVFARFIPMDPGSGDTCRLITVSCAFDDGTLGLMDINIEGRYGYEVSVEVVGSLGTARSLPPARAALKLDGEERHDMTTDGMARYATAYLAEAQAWVDSIRRGEPAGPGAWDGYVSVAVADACRASLAGGRSVPVSLVERRGAHA